MSILLWTALILMGLALLAWISSNFPARRMVLAGSLFLVVLICGTLSYMDIWQAVPATVISLVWLMVLVLVNKFGDAHASRPYSGVLFALLLVVAIAPIYSAPFQGLPETDGPYNVGMKEFVVTDTSRLGLRGVAADAPRKILVRAYYPADNVDGLTPRPYMTAKEYQTMAEAVAAMGQPGFMDSYKQHVATNTYEGSPVSKDGNFPMVLFSHGFTGPMAENLFIAENMVSHGNVVFMASHPGNTRAIVYPDGTTKIIDTSITNAMADAFVKMIAGDAPVYNTLDDYWDAEGPFLASQSPLFAESMDIWRDDMLAITDALFTQNVDAGILPIWQAIDNTKLAYVGMSFGGSTAGITCNADPRCGLAITLDGDNMSPHLVNTQTRAPVVSIQAPLGEFPGTAGMKGIGIGGANDLSFEPVTRAGQTGTVTRVVIANTKHLSYTDNASFWRGPVRPVFMVGTLPADETNAAINGMIGAALDLEKLFEVYLHRFGSSGFICSSIFDLFCMPPGEVAFGRFETDREWAHRYMTREYFLIDPIWTLASNKPSPSLWSECRAQVQASCAQKQLFEEAEACGMLDGLIIPVPHSKHPGAVNILHYESVSPEHLFDLQLASIYLYNSALAMANKRTVCNSKREPLTDRQAECLRWMILGKTDWEIGCILGISSSTVHKHIECLKGKLGVRTRVQAVVEAIQNGHMDTI